MAVCYNFRTFGVNIGWRKYLYECMPFWYVNLWISLVFDGDPISLAFNNITTIITRWFGIWFTCWLLTKLPDNDIIAHTTVCKKIIFHYLEDYNSANMTDIHKIPFDYWLDKNSWQLNFFDLFDLLMTLTSIFDLGVRVDTYLVLDALNY